MLEMYVARISEIDEAEVAMEELKSQIDFSLLKKNSGGVMFCHIEAVESGLVAQLCEQLPFDVIGMTSLATAHADGYSLDDIVITVLTSDEVSFEAGMTNDITKDSYRGDIDALYKGMRGKVSEDPRLILSFMPYMREVSGYEVVDAMNQAVGEIPIWGSITNDIDFNYETVTTICNGKCLQKGVAMMFLNGPIEPKFVISSIPERNIASNRAIITKSEGAVLIEVNDTPILEYLKNIGLIITRENITTTPLMVYYEGTEEPVALGFYTLFDDGSVLAGGEIPVGASFSVGNIDSDGIFESAEAGLKQILDIPDRSATLLLPCITRYIMLAPNQESELALITEKLRESGQPFMMGYSGGEICPVRDAGGKLRNRFHNYTFCACII